MKGTAQSIIQIPEKGRDVERSTRPAIRRLCRQVDRMDVERIVSIGSMTVFTVSLGVLAKPEATEFLDAIAPSQWESICSIVLPLYGLIAGGVVERIAIRPLIRLIKGIAPGGGEGNREKIPFKPSGSPYYMYLKPSFDVFGRVRHG